MAFLDFCLLILIIYLATQILLPLILPRQFRMNWIFRKRKSVADKINDLSEVKKNLSEDAKDVIDESDIELRNAKNINNQAKNLTKNNLKSWNQKRSSS